MRRDDSRGPRADLRPSEDLFGGSTAQGAGPAGEPEDAVELWARRFGRGLAILASVALIAWALATYGVPGGQ